MIIQPIRYFAPKAQGKGGPPTTASYVQPKRGKNVMEKLIDDGTEFVMGTPNRNPYNTRDLIQTRLGPRIELYAKKMREMYLREGTIPTEKTFLEAVRERGPTDTIEKCGADKLVPGVINARDEFPDVDLVFKWSVPFLIKRGEHSHVRPFYITHPETQEEIRVTCNNIDYHAKTRLPFYMDFQRYIVGRPNLINIPVVPVLEDKSAHYQAGCNFHYIVKDLWVWCFNDTYPARLEMDCSMMSPNMPIKIGDIERMLPYGMYLHKRYDN